MRNRRGILLIASLRDEIAPTVKRLGLQLYKYIAVGKVADCNVIASVTGLKHIGRHLEALLNEYNHDTVIHIGLSGALDPSLQSGQVVRINKVINEKGGAIELEGGRCDNTLLTVDHPICSPADKRSLFERFAACAVDMETYHVASVLQRHNVKLISLRAISDPANLALPPAAINWVRDDGSTNIPAAAAYLLGHPWKLPTIMQLRHGMKLGTQRLAEAVNELLESPVE